jgi:transcriptional regulator with GAF, ATPase, and Fis domain
MQSKTRGRYTKNVKHSKLAQRRKLIQPERKLEKATADLAVLGGVCGMMSQSLGDKRIFERMLNLIGRSVEFSRASLFLLDKTSNRMQEVASVGRTVDLIDFVRFDTGSGLSAWVAKEKRPILLSSLHRRRGGETMKSFLAVPLTLNDELFGVMNMGHIRAHAFEASDVEFLQLVSAPISLGLERMQCYRELERLQSEIEQAREHSSQLEEEIGRLRRMIPSSQLLESLNQKIKLPLADIADNARFLLETLSPRQEEKKVRSKGKAALDFKRGLRQIRNDAHQVTRTTERLLRRSLS